MEDKPSTSCLKQNREGKPLRRRGVSFNVLPIRERVEEAPVDEAANEPVLVDYSSFREERQLNFSNFLESDNPITFVLFTIFGAIRLYFQLLISPLILIKYLYLLLLKVYGVRRPNDSTSTSEIFSNSSTNQNSSNQQRPIVWILTLIDYIVFRLTQLPETMKKFFFSTIDRMFFLFPLRILLNARPDRN